jgi:predicted nucleic acid-binding protein
MIVYAESNFILELTLEQEELASAENVLATAERGQIILVVPSLAIEEPFSTIGHRSRIRSQVNTSISEQVRQLERSATHAMLATEIRAVTGKLASLEGHELMRLRNTVERVLKIATVVPVSLAVFAAAVDYESRFGLSLQDAVALASVMNHATAQPPTEPKVFANRNRKDFDAPDIVSLLATCGCELVVTFDDAWKRIEPHCVDP